MVVCHAPSSEVRLGTGARSCIASSEGWVMVQRNLVHQLGAVTEEGSCRQWLGEHISNHVVCANMRDRDSPVLLLLAGVVIGKVDVLRGGAVYWIVRHSNSTLAIAEEINGANEASHIQLSQ